MILAFNEIQYFNNSRFIYYLCQLQLQQLLNAAGYNIKKTKNLI
jgi:hypothetical protein